MALALLSAATQAGAQVASAASAALPFKPEQAAELPGAGQWLIAMLICALALGLALFWLRRRFGTGQAAWPGAGIKRELQVLERCQLGPQHQLVLLRCGERRLLLSIHPRGSELLRDELLDKDGQP